MRYLVLLAVLSASAGAQPRFLAECERRALSADVDYGAICACAADRVLAQGATPAGLEAVADFMAAGPDADPEAVPAEARAVAPLAAAAVLACAAARGVGGSSDGAVKARLSGQAVAATEAEAPLGPETPLTPEAIAAEAAAARSAPPAGIRTGNGNGPVRARQGGKGAAIRIVE